MHTNAAKTPLPPPTPTPHRMTDPKRYSRALLVNNAGSLGHICPVNELPSLSKLRAEMDFNVTSAFWLSSRFARLFGARQKPQISQAASSPSEEPAPTPDTEDVQEKEHDDVKTGSETSDASKNVVVNISSLAAVQPFESWCGYSAGKAARDMFHRRVEHAAVHLRLCASFFCIFWGGR